MKPNILALIPARGGSKGVPGKNKRMVGGKPLLRYSIDAALGATRVTHIVVNSDDPDILAIAGEAGVEGLARPADLARDDSPVIDAVRHTLDHLAASGCGPFQTIVLLQPTSPLRTAADIDHVVDLHLKTGQPVCSVYRCDDNHPARMYRMENDRLHPLMPELAQYRRQDLPPVFHRNGAIYAFGPAEVASGRIINDVMVPYVMSVESSINVDHEFDLAVLETVLRLRPCTS